MVTSIAAICLQKSNVWARTDYARDLYPEGGNNHKNNIEQHAQRQQQEAAEQWQEILEPWRQPQRQPQDFDEYEQQPFIHTRNSNSGNNNRRQRILPPNADYEHKSEPYETHADNSAGMVEPRRNLNDVHGKSLEPLEHVRGNKRAPNEIGPEELSAELPYGIQNVRKRQLHGAPFHITYQSLCPTKRVSIPLETSAFEYRPSQYIEVTCAHHFSESYNYEFNKNKICSEAGFSCVQLNRTIHLVRRNKAAIAECWESEIRIVPSGCECMWPKHDNGDIIAYHQAQKRYVPEANVQPNADYGAGEGYLQIPRQSSRRTLNGQGHAETPEGIGFDTYQLD